METTFGDFLIRDVHQRINLSDKHPKQKGVVFRAVSLRKPIDIQGPNGLHANCFIVHIIGMTGYYGLKSVTIRRHDILGDIQQAESIKYLPERKAYEIHLGKKKNFSVNGQMVDAPRHSRWIIYQVDGRLVWERMI